MINLTDLQNAAINQINIGQYVIDDSFMPSVFCEYSFDEMIKVTHNGRVAYVYKVYADGDVEIVYDDHEGDVVGIDELT